MLSNLTNTSADSAAMLDEMDVAMESLRQADALVTVATTEDWPRLSDDVQNGVLSATHSKIRTAQAALSRMAQINRSLHYALQATGCK